MSKQYSIQDVSRLSGLPSSTLRYYESIGIIIPIERDASSKHRVYGDDDLDSITAIACLSATGMSIEDMREYLKFRSGGAKHAHDEVELLEKQRIRLKREAEDLAIRQEYVSHKIAYWQAVENGDAKSAEPIAAEAHRLIDTLKRLHKGGGA